MEFTKENRGLFTYGAEIYEVGVYHVKEEDEERVFGKSGCGRMVRSTDGAGIWAELEDVDGSLVWVRKEIATEFILEVEEVRRKKEMRNLATVRQANAELECDCGIPIQPEEGDEEDERGRRTRRNERQKLKSRERSPSLKSKDAGKRFCGVRMEEAMDEEAKEAERTRAEAEEIRNDQYEDVMKNMRHRKIVEGSWWPSTGVQRNVVYVHGPRNTEDEEWRKRELAQFRCPPGLEDVKGRDDYPHPSELEVEAMEKFMASIISQGKAAANPGTTKGFQNNRVVILRNLPLVEAAIVCQWCMRLPGILGIRKEEDVYYLNFQEKAHVVCAIRIWETWNVAGEGGSEAHAECPYVGERGTELIAELKSPFFQDLEDMREKANRMEAKDDWSSKEVDEMMRNGGGLAWQEVEKNKEWRPGVTWYPGDWACLECRFINYGTRRKCSWCEQKKGMDVARPPKVWKSDFNRNARTGPIGRNQIPQWEFDGMSEVQGGSDQQSEEHGTTGSWHHVDEPAMEKDEGMPPNYGSYTYGGSVGSTAPPRSRGTEPAPARNRGTPPMRDYESL